jgi:uncharacterized membrane protein
MKNSLKIPDENRAAIVWLGIVCSLALLLRGFFLSQPMRFDEACTFRYFVKNGFVHVFSYTVPNNHIFHTLCAYVSTAVFGGYPAALRLPALLAGLISIPCVMFLSRLLTKRDSGYLASCLLAAFPYMILYDTNARGYSLVALLSLLLAVSGLAWLSRPSPGRLLAVSAVSALGMWTMPSFLFAAAGLYFWMAALFIYRNGPKRLWRAFIIPCGIFTLAGTAVLYLPTVAINRGLHSLTQNSYVADLPWKEFFSAMPAHLKQTYSLFVRHFPAWLQWSLGGLIAAAAGFSIRKKNMEILFLLPALVLGSAAVLLLKHAVPYDRTWIFFIPFLLVFADAGFTFLTGFLRPRLRTGLLFLVFLLTCAWGIRSVNRNAVGRFPDTGAFPEAPVLVRFLAPVLTPNDLVISQCPADETIHYYMGYYDVPSSGSGPDTTEIRRFYVVKKNQYGIEDLTRDRVVPFLEYVNASVYVSPSTDARPAPAGPHHP